MVSKMTPLKDLFEAIERRISDEQHTSEFITLQDEIKPQRMEYQVTAKIFSEIEGVNRRFLAKFALYRMRTEMSLASFYRHRNHDEPVDEDSDQLKNIAVRTCLPI
jgi:hypothetical protein